MPDPFGAAPLERWREPMLQRRFSLPAMPLLRGTPFLPSRPRVLLQY